LYSIYLLIDCLLTAFNIFSVLHVRFHNNNNNTIQR